MNKTYTIMAVMILGSSISLNAVKKDEIVRSIGSLSAMRFAQSEKAFGILEKNKGRIAGMAKKDMKCVPTKTMRRALTCAVSRGNRTVLPQLLELYLNLHPDEDINFPVAVISKKEHARRAVAPKRTLLDVAYMKEKEAPRGEKATWGDVAEIIIKSGGDTLENIGTPPPNRVYK